MAQVHIGEDLRRSLRKNGVGDDSLWNCMGDVIEEAAKEHFFKQDLKHMRLAGEALGNTYDVDKYKDVMQDETKAEGVPACK